MQRVRWARTGEVRAARREMLATALRGWPPAELAALVGLLRRLNDDFASALGARPPVPRRDPDGTDHEPQEHE